MRRFAEIARRHRRPPRKPERKPQAYAEADDAAERFPRSGASWL